MNEIALRLAAKLFDQRLIQNQFRSLFIEMMLEPFLAASGWRYVGDNWGGWDFERGEQRLEVKQSAAHQTWAPLNKTPFRGTFDIAARTGYWADGGSRWVSSPGIRFAGVYVFAWNPIYGDQTGHRNSAQWQFFVVRAHQLPLGQRTIALSRIRTLTNAVPIQRVADVVENASP